MERLRGPQYAAFCSRPRDAIREHDKAACNIFSRSFFYLDPSLQKTILRVNPSNGHTSRTPDMSEGHVEPQSFILKITLLGLHLKNRLLQDTTREQRSRKYYECSASTLTRVTRIFSVKPCFLFPRQEFFHWDRKSDTRHGFLSAYGTLNLVCNA